MFRTLSVSSVVLAVACGGELGSYPADGSSQTPGDTVSSGDATEAGDTADDPPCDDFRSDLDVCAEVAAECDVQLDHCGLERACGSCSLEAHCTVAKRCMVWHRGGLHTHSNLSDGATPPSEVAARYRQLGYGFVVLTDHNIWSDFAQYSTAEFVALDGEEVTSVDRVHVNGIGTSGVIAASTFQENIDNVRVHGGLPLVNHPTWSGHTLDTLFRLESFELMEIYNHATGGYSEPLWDGLLTAGKRVFGVAADDAHNMSTASGNGWVVARTTVLSKAEILGALVSGDFYASTGVTLANIVPQVDRLRVESLDGEYIEFIGQNGRVLATLKQPEGEYLYDGSEKYVRARVTGLGGRAWTQPVLRHLFGRDPHADAVLASAGISSGQAENLVGPPLPGRIPANWWDFSARIDAGGYVVLDMGSGEEVVDSPGPDLYVEEVDEEDGVGGAEPYLLFASNDGSSWTAWGQGTGDTTFDLASIPLESARYIKIEVQTGNVEIDGVQILDPTFRDRHADAIIDATRVTAGQPVNLLGPPFPGPIPNNWADYCLQIAAGGSVVLDMGPAEPIPDIPGPDFRVEEVDAEDSGGGDPYEVYVSRDAVTWVSVGPGTGDTSFDLAPTRLGSVRYVKLEVTSGDAEFDAVEAF